MNTDFEYRLNTDFESLYTDFLSCCCCCCYGYCGEAVSAPAVQDASWLSYSCCTYTGGGGRGEDGVGCGKSTGGGGCSGM